MTESTHEQPRQRTKRQRLPVIVWQRPRCPACGGVELRKYRSIRDQGDGSAMSWVQCMDDNCGHRFRIVLE